MAINESVFAAELRERHGVTTRVRLRAVGLTNAAIDRLVAVGRLNRVRRGVFVSPTTPDTFERRVAIACAVTGGVASFPTAGRLWKMRKTPRDEAIHVLVPWTRRITSFPGVVIHRTSALPPTDIVRRRGGIALTSPPRTMFDAAAFVSSDDLESMIEQGIDRGMFIVPTLWATARRLCANARPGGWRFARVLNSRGMWRKPVESDYELRLERALRKRGFPPLERGHALEILPGRFVHPDLGLPDDGFYIEVDHVAWHGGRVDSDYDKWRDTKVRLRGLHVERVPDTSIDKRLPETVGDLWTMWQLVRERNTPKDVA